MFNNRGDMGISMMILMALMMLGIFLGGHGLHKKHQEEKASGRAHSHEVSSSTQSPGDSLQSPGDSLESGGPGQ